MHVTAVACSGSSCVSGGGGWGWVGVCGACGWVAVLGSCGCEEIEVWVHRVGCVMRDARTFEQVSNDGFAFSDADSATFTYV